MRHAGNATRRDAATFREKRAGTRRAQAPCMRKLFDVLVAQCGFRSDRLSVGWTAGGVASFAIFHFVRQANQPGSTILYFVATSLFYYAGNVAYLWRWNAGGQLWAWLGQ